MVKISIDKSRTLQAEAAAILPQCVAVFIANLGAFMMGVCRGWTATSEAALVDRQELGFFVTVAQFSWVGSLMPLGAMLGASPLTGWLVNRVGRRTSLAVLSLPMVVGFTLTAWAGNVPMLCVGRLLTGLSSGGYGVVIPLYVAEVADSNIRGRLGVVFQTFITLGILFSYVAGSLITLFWLTFLCTPLAALHGLLVFSIPESPTYYLQKENEELAKTALQYLRGRKYDIQDEIANKKKAIEEARSLKLTLLEAFSSKSAKKGLVICMGVMFFRQFSGVSGIIFYNNVLFKEAGAAVSPNLQTIILGLVDLTAIGICSTMVDKLGRRPLLLFSDAMMSVSTFVIGLFFFLKDRDYDVSYITWIPVTFSCVFFIAFSSGFGPLPWVIQSEIFPRRVAGYAASLGCMINYFCVFLVTRYFEVMSFNLGREWVFFFFSICSCMGVMFVYYVVPETKKKSIEDIVRELEK